MSVLCLSDMETNMTKKEKTFEKLLKESKKMETEIVSLFNDIVAAQKYHRSCN